MMPTQNIRTHLFDAARPVSQLIRLSCENAYVAVSNTAGASARSATYINTLRTAALEKTTTWNNIDAFPVTRYTTASEARGIVRNISTTRWRICVRTVNHKNPGKKKNTSFVYTVLYHAMFGAMAGKKPLLGWVSADGRKLSNRAVGDDLNLEFGVYFLVYGSFNSANAMHGVEHHQILHSLIDDAVTSLQAKWSSDANIAEKRVAHMEHRQEIRNVCEKALKLVCGDDLEMFYTKWPQIEKMLDKELGSDETVHYARTTLASIKRHNAGMKHYLTSKHAHLCKEMEGNEDLFDVNMHINMTLVNTFCNHTYSEKLADLIDLAARVLVADDDHESKLQKLQANRNRVFNNRDGENWSAMLEVKAHKAPSTTYGHNPLLQRISRNLHFVHSDHADRFFDNVTMYSNLFPRLMPLLIRHKDVLLDCQKIGKNGQAVPNDNHANYIDVGNSIFKTSLASRMFVHPSFLNQTSSLGTIDLAVADPTIWKVNHGWHNNFVILCNTKRESANIELAHFADEVNNIGNQELQKYHPSDISIFRQCSQIVATNDPATQHAWTPLKYARKTGYNIGSVECSLTKESITSASSDEYYKLVPVPDDAGPADGCIDFDISHGWHTGSSPSAVLDVFYAIQTFLHERIQNADTRNC